MSTVGSQNESRKRTLCHPISRSITIANFAGGGGEDRHAFQDASRPNPLPALRVPTGYAEVKREVELRGETRPMLPETPIGWKHARD
jgi:hypothetical protein